MLCQQPETVALATRACRELGVELHYCSTAKAAIEKIALQKFHGVIVDDQDGPNAALLLKDLRASAHGKKSVIIALAKTDAVLEAVFGAGTHLVIYKPLTHDKLRNGLRAIRPLMGKQQHRSSLRVKVDIPANLAVSDTENIPVKILDLSGGGAALSLPSPCLKVKSLKLSFALPGEETMITIAAEVVWKNAWGNLGITFVNIDPAFTHSVSRWMKGHPVVK
jgi:PilZ domain